MSQGVIPLSAGGGGAAVRGKINDALQRLQTKGSGTARPSDIAAGEDWIETDNPGAGTWSWWLYDGTSDILLGTINSTTHALTWSNSIAASLLTTKGDLIKGGVSGTPARFGVGGAFYGLHVNSAGDDLEYRRNGWEKIADDAVPSSAAAVTFSSIPSNVKALRVIFDLIPATNGVALYGRFAQSGSLVTSSSYIYAAMHGGSSGDVSSTGSGGTTVWPLTGALGIYNLATSAPIAGVAGVIDIANIQTARTVRGSALLQSSHTGNGGIYTTTSGVNMASAAGAIDGLSLFFSSGNIGEGRVSLLGLRA